MNRVMQKICKAILEGCCTEGKQGSCKSYRKLIFWGQNAKIFYRNVVLMVWKQIWVIWVWETEGWAGALFPPISIDIELFCCFGAEISKYFHQDFVLLKATVLVRKTTAPPLQSPELHLKYHDTEFMNLQIVQKLGPFQLFPLMWWESRTFFCIP